MERGIKKSRVKEKTRERKSDGETRGGGEEGGRTKAGKKIGGAEEGAREDSLARQERIFEYYTARVNRVPSANEQRATQETHLPARWWGSRRPPDLGWRGEGRFLHCVEGTTGV